MAAPTRTKKGHFNYTEYAYNTNTAGNVTDTTSFNTDDGTAGVLMSNATSGQGAVKRVRFPTAYRNGDTVFIEIQEPSRTTWIRADDRNMGAVRQGSSTYGFLIVQVSGSNTDFDITMLSGGNNPNNGTYNNSGEAWSNYFSAGWKWRAVKISNGF